MLKTLFHQGKVNHSIMDAVAGKLVDFHRHAATGGSIDQIGSIETIRRNHDENFEETEPFVNITIPPHQYHFIKSYAYNFINSHHALLNKRVQTTGSERAMETFTWNTSALWIQYPEKPTERFLSIIPIILLYLTASNSTRGSVTMMWPPKLPFWPWIWILTATRIMLENFVHAYIRYSGDSEIGKLLNFYKCYYAYVRGKVVGFELNEDSIGHDDREEAAKTAARYFDLSYTYAARLENPTLILMAGLTGTGKSVRAKLIADRIGADIIVTDMSAQGNPQYCTNRAAS